MVGRVVLNAAIAHKVPGAAGWDLVEEAAAEAAEVAATGRVVVATAAAAEQEEELLKPKVCDAGAAVLKCSVAQQCRRIACMLFDVRGRRTAVMNLFQVTSKAPARHTAYVLLCAAIADGSVAAKPRSLTFTASCEY
jgi:hypothetical protein